MIDRLGFEGGLQLGPASFVKATGRDQVWAKKPQDGILTQERNCPSCGAQGPANRKLLFCVDRPNDLNQWDYHRCLACGMIYTVNAPTEEAMAKVYKQAPAQQAWVGLQQNETELAFDKLKFGWALEWAGWPFGDRRILDIGCSTGTLLEVACGMAEHAGPAGVEINQDAKKVLVGRFMDLKKSVTLHDTLETCCLSSVKYDLVALWEVLEHVLDPQKMLAQASSLVRPGGQILICVPNANSLACQVLHEKAPCWGLGHLNMFDQWHLMNMLRDFGDFSVTSIISWHRELTNWSNLLGPFDADPGEHDAPPWLPSAKDILDDLLGYKLVLTAKKGKS